MALDNDIERILWNEEEISQRVSELASQITQDFSDTVSSSAPVVVGVATGAFLFLADLVRKIKLPITVDFVRAESYGFGTESNGAPRISCDLKIDIQGKNVILVEDIVDTGNTLSCLIAHLKSKGASSISVCTLLDKPSRRKVNFELVGKGKFYCGFECPDYFVVGYGLDFAEVYRNLPYVGVLKPEIIIPKPVFDIVTPATFLGELNRCVRYNFWCFRVKRQRGPLFQRTNLDRASHGKTRSLQFYCPYSLWGRQTLPHDLENQLLCGSIKTVMES